MKILIRYIVLLVMFVGLNGCENPNQSTGNITQDKMQDLNAIDLKGAVNMVKGSAVSMGREVGN